MVQNDFSSTSCYYRYENIFDKSDDDDALLFLSRLTSFLPRRSSFCASPVGLSLPDRRVSVCVCVCARKTPREEEEEEEEDVRLCQCRLILKGKEMQKDDAKKKKEKSLSLYQTVFVQTGDERGRGKKNDQSGRDARVVHADFFISQRGRHHRHHHRLVGWSNPSLLLFFRYKKEGRGGGGTKQPERRHKKF